MDQPHHYNRSEIQLENLSYPNCTNSISLSRRSYAHFRGPTDTGQLRTFRTKSISNKVWPVPQLFSNAVAKLIQHCYKSSEIRFHYIRTAPAPYMRKGAKLQIYTFLYLRSLIQGNPNSSGLYRSARSFHRSRNCLRP